MTLLDGKAVAALIRGEIKDRAAAFLQRAGRRAGLAVVVAGEDPASAVYVRNKVKACEETGIRSVVYRLSGEATQEEALSLIERLAKDDGTDGILVQLPLPPSFDEDALLAAIPPSKDVDGFSAANMGALALGRAETVPCTPLGVMELLRQYKIEVAGKRAVVIGRSRIVGRPMALLLLGADATVTVCHSRTRGLKEETLRADIIVSAVGRAGLVTADMVKEGTVVVDVGMCRDQKGKLCGDVDFEGVAKKASYLTPVPGGVGPMTVAMLLQNTCKAAEGHVG